MKESAMRTVPAPVHGLIAFVIIRAISHAASYLRERDRLRAARNIAADHPGSEIIIGEREISILPVSVLIGRVEPAQDRITALEDLSGTTPDGRQYLPKTSDGHNGKDPPRATSEA
jgi:hypothetical protein